MARWMHGRMHPHQSRGPPRPPVACTAQAAARCNAADAPRWLHRRRRLRAAMPGMQQRVASCMHSVCDACSNAWNSVYRSAWQQTFFKQRFTEQARSRTHHAGCLRGVGPHVCALCVCHRRRGFARKHLAGLQASTQA